MERSKYYSEGLIKNFAQRMPGPGILRFPGKSRTSKLTSDTILVNLTNLSINIPFPLQECAEAWDDYEKEKTAPVMSAYGGYGGRVGLPMPGMSQMDLARAQAIQVRERGGETLKKDCDIAVMSIPVVVESA